MPQMESAMSSRSVEVVSYTIFDAARYLRIPVWYAMAAARPKFHPLERAEYFWMTGRFLNEDDFAFHSKNYQITFSSLSALYVSTCFFRALEGTSSGFPRHPSQLFDIFRTLSLSIQKLNSDSKWMTDAEWVLEQMGDLRELGIDQHRHVLLKLVFLHQSRIESKNGLPIQLFPFAREPDVNAPRMIVIDPEIRFGRPTVKGAPTDVLAERWRAGDRLAEIADDYGLTTEEVEEAMRYESDRPCSWPMIPPPFFW
jgi:uncharacterized protein (DUF433 family)